MPSEEQGKYKFSDFTRDDKKMNQLFESFIRNFYKIEQQKYKTVKKETIKWQFDNTDKDSYQYLPQMETDITLENDEYSNLSLIALVFTSLGKYHVSYYPY